MTEEERDELIRKALFKFEPKKHVADTLSKHFKGFIKFDETITGDEEQAKAFVEEREELVKQFYKEWDEFYAKNSHTGHMPPELLTFPKQSVKDGYDK